MSISHIDVTTPDGVADAILALPETGEARHGVLFLMDAFGIRPVIEQMAQRIADRGYAVLAPNLYYRSGRAPLFEVPDMSSEESRTAFFGQVRPFMAELTPERMVADGRAYIDRLQQETPGPVAITGYCMGARHGLRLAAADPSRVVALGGFHGGGLVTEEPDSPHREVGKVRAEVFFGHADNDQSNTPEQIEALDRAFAEAGVAHGSDVYAGAPHGYTMADTPSYREDAAERHFDDLFALLDRAFAAQSVS
jgi:carboxymethylenebutenolidase